MSQAASTLTSTWLSDEAILGLEPDTSAPAGAASGAVSGPDGFADPSDSVILSEAKDLAVPHEEQRGANSADARSANHSAADAAADPNANADATQPVIPSPPRRTRNPAVPRGQQNGDRTSDSTPDPRAAPPPDAGKRDTSVTIHALPAATLEQLDAAYYSPEPQTRAQFAETLFANDPASFRAMFNEAARLLGVNVGESAAGQAFLPAQSAPVQQENRAEINSAPTTANTVRPDAPGVSADQNSVIPSEARNLSASAAQQSPVFPAQQYRAFEAATNATLANEVRAAITATLDHALPEGTAEGAARRIADDIFTDIGKHLASDAQLSSQVGEVLRGWQFGPQEQRQVSTLLSDRARQLLPSAARKVIGEWSSNVLATARTRAARSEASASRVDVGNAASRPAAASEPARALKPKEIDYARTSDDDIFAM